MSKRYHFSNGVWAFMFCLDFCQFTLGWIVPKVSRSNKDTHKMPDVVLKATNNSE